MGCGVKMSHSSTKIIPEICKVYINIKFEPVCFDKSICFLQKLLSDWHHEGFILPAFTINVYVNGPWQLPIIFNNPSELNK